MKIKRYFAADMRQAIRQVRAEQGPDAVILSNRRVQGGIEIIAAVDYDESLIHAGLHTDAPGVSAAAAENTVAPDYGSEVAPTASALPPQVPAAGIERPAVNHNDIVWSQDPAMTQMRREIAALRGLLEDELAHLAWSDMGRRKPHVAGLLRRLTALGLSPALSRHIADRVSTDQEPEQGWRQALALLAELLPVTDDDILSDGGVIALVGPTGVGKTTTVAKLAARFALRHGQRQVSLVTTDNYRIGAHEQLLTFGRILGVPVQSASDHDELQSIINGQLDKKLVIVDTAGMSQRDMRLSEQLATLRGEGTAIKTYLVVSATTQRSGVDEVIRSFSSVPLSGCILTKLDEATGLGGALSSLIERRLPLAYVGDGQRVPEDMHPARAHALVNRAVTLLEPDAEAPGEDLMAFSFGGRAAHA
jgi:flagellar biosynthesis protein FlhF